MLGKTGSTIPAKEAGSSTIATKSSHQLKKKLSTGVKADDNKIIHKEQEEQEVRREDTLFEIANLRDYTSRRVEPEDLTEIKRLLTNDDYEFFKCENPNVLL